MKVAISARNFVFEGCGAVELLESRGFETVNITDRVFNNENDYFEAIKDADALINAFEPMSANLISKCVKLKLISVRGVGYDYIDAEACRKNGIAISRAVGTVGGAVSELCISYMLHFARQVSRQSEAMHSGRWERLMTDGLDGKTLGIIGFGEIGQALAKKADVFGMRVIYNCLTAKNEPKYAFTDLNTLYEQSDYIVLALPLNEKTQGMINTDALSRMKRSAVLINVARSGIADNSALYDALKNGAIRAAAIDVYENEPCTDSVFRGLDNVLLTPHTAPFTQKNFTDMNMLAAQNVIRFFDGSIESRFLVR